ncbi:UDP-N-acetylbacillosamine N-acetyltransferase [Campylobacter geochelonis]|uniref:UDP-N-acetylbacillosamine N-acetyltransferase n=1 Tax=Campylobacter geochelonis TaxID=1780362 RepID=UPI00077089F2|nr:UDP-N-acetylbacillosamine N-acetyltransferase [Campylobacter geochelonis]CZE47010.1 general glycosylation pathway protein [Campylobacter geochelonis]
MVKTKIYIYGASGHGQVLSDIARACGYDEVVFLDDSSDTKFSKDLPKFDIFIGVGVNDTRAMLQEKVQKCGFKVVNLIHPSAVISPSAKFGVGVCVMPNVVVNAFAKVSDGVILNSGCVVEHECVIERFAHISPNAALAGNVYVGEFSHIGIGSSVIQGIKIGSNVSVGAGSVVVRNLAPNGVYVGVPTKFIKEK